MSSSMFPWASEYKLQDLPQYEKIKNVLTAIGKFVIENQMRLTCHPGQFNILSSNRVSVIENSYKDLIHHAEIFDLMGLPQTHYYKINIHVGASYGNKIEAANRFINNFKELPDNVKSRLTLENEDKKSLFTTQELYELIYKKTNIPIVFDYLHHKCNPGIQSEFEALNMACSTWNGIKPVVHYASSKKLFEDSNCKLLSHADYIYEKIDTYGLDVDIMLESKMKDLSLLTYNKSYKIH